MTRFFAVLATTLIVLSLGLGPVGAVSANETEGDSEVIPTDEGSEFEIVIDEHTRITEFELDESDRSVSVTFDVDRRASVTMGDSLAGVDRDGATQVPTETFAILEGEEQTITKDGLTVHNGGMMVGVEVNGEQIRLSSSMDEHGGDNPLRYFGGESGVFAGIGLSVSMAALGAGFVVWREDKGVVKA